MAPNNELENDQAQEVPWGKKGSPWIAPPADS